MWSRQHRRQPTNPQVFPPAPPGRKNFFREDQRPPGQQICSRIFHQPDSENAMNGLICFFPDQIMAQWFMMCFWGTLFLCLCVARFLTSWSWEYITITMVIRWVNLRVLVHEWLITVKNPIIRWFHWHKKSYYPRTQEIHENGGSKCFGGDALTFFLCFQICEVDLFERSPNNSCT